MPTPDWLTAERLAGALSVPVGYLYELDDVAAELLLAYFSLPLERRHDAVAAVRDLLDS